MLHPSHHARTQPDKVAYLMAASGKTLTYRELDDTSNRGAQLLRSLGLDAGDHMALLFENSLRFFEICWAAQRSGIYYTAISTYLVADEIAYIVGDCGAKVFVVSDALKPLAEMLAGMLPAGTACYMSGAAAPGWISWDAALAAQPATPIADQIVGYDMLYSSGTTGRPKGVKPQFKNEPLGTLSPLLRLLVQKMCGVNEHSVYLSPAPLYHAAPLRFNMMVGALGGTSVIMEKFDPEEYLRLAQKHHCTQTQLVPTMFVRMLKLPDEVRAKYDVSSLQAAVHAAAPCPVDVKQKMIDWWGPIFIEYYAGTEGNGVTIANTGSGSPTAARSAARSSARSTSSERTARNVPQGRSARSIFPAAPSSPITTTRSRPKARTTRRAGPAWATSATSMPMATSISPTATPT